MSDDKDSRIGLYLNLLACLIDSGKAGYLKFRNASIKPQDLEKDSADCLRFIEEYYQTYGDVPTRAEFQQGFQDQLPPSSGKLEFWIDEFLKTKMADHANNAVQAFGFKANKDMAAALDELETSIKFIKNLKRTVEFVHTRELIEELRKKYADAKANVIGIPTPWKAMDSWTQGWNPGDLCFLGARTGKGKTFFTILALIAAIKSGKIKKCLYASGEMPPVSILQRYAAMDHKVSYEKVRKGSLSDLNQTIEDGYLTYLDTTLRALDTLVLLDASKTGFTLQNIGAAIESSEADFVIVDAAYMLRLEKPLPSHESMGKIAQGLKEFALKYRVPIIASTQLNRASLQKTSQDDSDFALSDQIAWNSDFMFILSQSDDQYKARQMQINPVKIREGANTKEGLTISWCFDRMDFSEAKSNVAQMEDYKNKSKKHFQDMDPNDPDHPTAFF
jgi:replicative DNA helicase